MISIDRVTLCVLDPKSTDPKGWKDLYDVYPAPENNMALVDPAKLAGQRVSIRAYCSGGPKSVRITVDGSTWPGKEDEHSEPFLFAGDLGDASNLINKLGQRTFTALAWPDLKAQGDAAASVGGNFYLQADAPAPALGSISGRVMNKGGTGLSGISVYDDADNNHKQDAGELCTTTNGNGDYSFGDLPPRPADHPYKIRAVVPAGMKQLQPPTPSGVDVNTAYYGHTIPLSAGQKLTSQNFIFDAADAPAAGGSTGSSSTSGGSSTPPTSTRHPLRGTCGGSGLPTATWQKLRVDQSLDFCRIWGPTPSWANKPTAGFFDSYRRFRDATGLKIAMCFHATKRPDTADQVTRWYDAAAKVASGAIDWWEIQNEVNIASYGSINGTDYVNQFLAPASKALRAAGQKIIGCNTSGIDPTWSGKAKAAGYMTLCDYGGFHPYDDSGIKQLAQVDRGCALYPGMMLFITEWGFHSGPAVAKWAQCITDAYPALAANPQIYALAYFETERNSAHQAGPEGLLWPTSHAPNEPFYSALKATAGKVVSVG
jgi:hypothetical protein